ncbi:MAG: DVUA0089 family protein [Azoarcus sp.]|jgi:hypothetical protein|nr:DVUA0089 family protein [Azoarcus sp.]
MKRLASALVTAGLLSLSVGSQAGTFHFTGDFADASDVVYGAFTVTDYDSVNLLFTDSYAEGNFDPILFVWDARGNLLASDDDSGPSWDALLYLTGLAAGNYYFGITQFPNWNNGNNLTDGFTYGGQTQGAPYLGASWSLYVTGAASAKILPGVPAVPEPETYAMLLAGLGVVGAVARRRSKKI